MGKRGQNLQAPTWCLWACTPLPEGKATPFPLANRIVRPSYVSLQSALAHYGLIPETVHIITSVTTIRPGSWKTPVGVFKYRHVKKDLFFGYQLVDLGGGQEAFVALPEKALLDLIYIQPDRDKPNYLQELRLQNLERVSPETLRQLAHRIGRPKLMRGIEYVLRQREEEIKGSEEL